MVVAVSDFDRIGVLAVLPPDGLDSQSHLLADGAGEEATDRVRLPAANLLQFLRGSTAGSFQKIDDSFLD
jgi:hypothetical protein